MSEALDLRVPGHMNRDDSPLHPAPHESKRPIALGGVVALIVMVLALLVIVALTR
ncbi:hypothetical protein [Nocardioides sp. R-C-SC26]|uniref:hypothetical protein n=1 Tax=Nocardioides sp. R-C-SC26 TaxID=2870414 RepID=UPI001E4D23FF|nr:hypothetical protein [Nocardioides sp. R-C-SC26]